MATYAEIRQWVQNQYCFLPKTSWIAEVKSSCGLPVRVASNRYDSSRREEPCPPERREAIISAFRHFGMI